MWYVLEAVNETLLATSYYEDVAKYIATILPCACIVRFANGFNSSAGEHANFFEKTVKSA